MIVVTIDQETIATTIDALLTMEEITTLLAIVITEATMITGVTTTITTIITTTIAIRAITDHMVVQVDMITATIATTIATIATIADLIRKLFTSHILRKIFFDVVFPISLILLVTTIVMPHQLVALVTEIDLDLALEIEVGVITTITMATTLEMDHKEVMDIDLVVAMMIDLGREEMVIKMTDAAVGQVTIDTMAMNVDLVAMIEDNWLDMCKCFWSLLCSDNGSIWNLV